MMERLFLKNMLGKAETVFFLFLVLANTAKSQIVFKVDPASKMTIGGTSTLHDWTSQVTQTKGSASFITDQGKITGISHLLLEFPVKSIKSDKSLMDSKTYDALKSETNPVIKFCMDKAKQVSGNSISALGTLTIAGITKNIELAATIEELSGNKIVIRGEKSLRMSDFSVNPPSAMMGTIKTGDEITVRFETVFAKTDNSETVTQKR